MTKKPVYQMVEWYDHELNPLGKWLLKYGGGLPALAWLKALVLVHIAHVVHNTPPSMMLLTTYIFLALCTIYVGVIINNMIVIKKLELRAHKVMVKKRKKKKAAYEDPLLPI